MRRPGPHPRLSSDATRSARRGDAAERHHLAPCDKSKEDGMAGELKIEVNDVVHSVAASPETPLLYVLRNELHRRAPRGHCRHREVRAIRGTRERVARCAEPRVIDRRIYILRVDRRGL